MMPTQSTNETLMIATKSFMKVDTENRKLFCLNRLKQLPIEIIKVDSTNEITIDGISGFEIIAAGKDKKHINKRSTTR